MAVSRRSQSAVSRAQVLRDSVPIAEEIGSKKCSAIVPSIGSSEGGKTGPIRWSKVPPIPHSKIVTGRYQADRERYQAPRMERDAVQSPQPARSKSGDTAVMIKIGLLLGLAYLAFLAVWIWATRLRPHLTRHGRGI